MRNHVMWCDPAVLRDIAEKELDAAIAGYDVWARFVREAEKRTGRPWEYIREDLNELHRSRAANSQPESE